MKMRFPLPRGHCGAAARTDAARARHRKFLIQRPNLDLADLGHAMDW